MPEWHDGCPRMFELNLSLTFNLFPASNGMSEGSLYEREEEAMSDERIKRIAEEIRKDTKGRRQAALEATERQQKIEAYAPRVWEELVKVVQSIVEGVNDELRNDSSHFAFKKSEYYKLSVRRKEPPQATLHLIFNLKKLSVEASRNASGKRESEPEVLGFDLDSAGQVRLTSDGRVLDTDEAAEIMLEAIWLPRDEEAHSSQ